MARRTLRAIVCAVFLSLLATPVQAHAALVSATPGAGDKVAGSPVELVATFSQDLDPSRTSLEVRDASGSTVARGGEPGDGPRAFRLELPQLMPGEYEVRWTSFSAEDGELARGTYTFAVLAAASPTPTPSASPTQSSPPPSTPKTAPPTASPPPTATPAPSETPASDDGAVLIPIVAALFVVVAIGIRFVVRWAT